MTAEGFLPCLHGDIVIGDEDGAVTFAQADAPAPIATVRAQEAYQADMPRTIAEGRYTGAYSHPAAASGG